MEQAQDERVQVRYGAAHVFKMNVRTCPHFSDSFCWNSAPIMFSTSIDPDEPGAKILTGTLAR